ncbi:MAG TPA: hypothetical protein P5092_07320, partial [Ruminococcus sp.]|nr:hypothetical protein [Ruminococcus sp.]
MKKLLSAVTSLAMSASVATSALSSMNVSAAGGSSAVQPNVSMGDILDVSAMKTADVPSAVLQKASDIKVFPEKDVYEVKAGDTIKELSLMIDAGSHSVGMYALEFDTVPNGFTISNPSKVNLAAQDTAWQTVGNAYYCNSIGGGGDPIKPSTSDPIFYFDLAVGSNVAPGEYTLNLKRVDTIESTSNGYTATVQPIKIKVAGPATTAAVTNAPAQNNPTQALATYAPATQAPATQGSQTPAQSPAQSQLKLDSSFKFFPEKDLYTAKAGDTVKEILMMVEPGNHSVGMYALEFDSLPSGFTLVNPSKTNEAAEDTAWNKVGDVYFNNSLNGGDPIKPSTEDPLFYFDLQIASTVPDGVYTINFKRLDVIESPESSFTAATTPVKIQVGDSLIPGVTYAPATNAPATNAPATNTPAQGNQPAAQNPTTSDKQLAVNSEFKLFPEKDNYEIKAGSTQKEILLFVEPGTHSSGMYALEFGDLPAGFTMKNPSKTNEAAEDTAWNKVGDVYYNNSLNGGDPIKPSTEDPLFYFDLEVASTVAPGEYTIPIKRLDVIESQDKQFGAAVTPVKVTVTNSGTVTPTSATPTNAAIPTNAQNPSTSDFVVKPGTYNVKAGEDVDVEVMVENGGHNPGMYAVEFDSLPDGITMKKFDGINLAQDDSPWKANGSTYNCNSLAAGGDPVTFNASEPIMTFKLSTSKDLKPGDYEFTFKRFHVVDSKTVEYDAKVEKGIIRITSDATDAPATTPTQATPTNAPTTTATPAPTPTSAQVTPTNAPQQTPTNPSSQTPAASGSVAWDIADKVPAKAGSTVEVPIKVSGNGDLTVAGAQFKVKAAKGSLSSAKTPSVYADAVEFNTNTNEIAFGNGTGAGSAVKDGDAVATLVISVPAGTPAGEYAVDFDKDSFLCVVDGNGNDITSKVTLTNGSILVGDVATGGATWD